MKSTTKILVLPALLAVLMVAGIPFFSSAQRMEKFREKKEKVEAQKVAYITDKLSLTPDEAKAFWPVYNEYQVKRKEEMKKFSPKDLDDMGTLENLTDKQMTELADNRIIHEQTMLDLEKDFHARLKGVLPIKKVLLYYQAEKQFRKELLHKIGEHREGRPGPRMK